jgi:hypothetical protein
MKIRMIRKTDQWNNEDFAAGSRVFTISHVTEGKEQVPYDIHFSDGEGRCWRPSNGMLELLLRIWGDDTNVWAGRRVQLFQDATVKIGRDVVGGIRVRSISHINKPMSPLITVSKGTKKPYTVQPLADAPAPAPNTLRDESGRDWLSELTLAGDDLEAIAALGKAASDAHANPADVAQIRARWNELKGTNA